MSDLFSAALDPAERCDVVTYGPQRLRLLSRREYANTVTAVLGDCDAHVFQFDGTGQSLSSVHVAGTFNDWAPTVAQGGWPMTQDASGLWTVARALPLGIHRYKFVLDEREWITDPSNPRTERDGEGNVNSIVELGCQDPSSTLPPDVRPEQFPFDDHAESAHVTSARLEIYMELAQALTSAIDDCQGECARGEILARGRVAFRRPLTEAEIERYASLGLRGGLEAMLSSPHFLYRSELGVADGDGYALSTIELASALSYFFWGGPADQHLLDRALSGELADPEVLDEEARRLLAAPRARETLGAFTLMWLGVDSLPDLTRASTGWSSPTLGDFLFSRRCSWRESRRPSERLASPARIPLPPADALTSRALARSAHLLSWVEHGPHRFRESPRWR